MNTKMQGFCPLFLLLLMPLFGIRAQHTVTECETVDGLQVIEWPLFEVGPSGQFINKGELRFPGVTTITNNGGFSESDQGSCAARYSSPCNDTPGNAGLNIFDNSVDETTINGNSPLRMFDVRLHRNLELYNELQVLGTFTFEGGFVHTDRSNSGFFLHFLNNSQCAGMGADKHVVGYVGWSGNGNFQLPLGDGFRYMPAAVTGVCGTLYKGAFFPVSPEQAVLPFGAPFNPTYLGSGLLGVSESEYWDVDGSGTTAITLFFDIHSDLSSRAGSLDEVVIAGWNGIQWVNLGNAGQTGNLNAGSVTSEPIVPDDYMAFTFGFVDNPAFAPTHLKVTKPAASELFTSKTPDNDRLALYQNRPNPFRDKTIIGYYVPLSCEITMKFYEAGGKLVREQKEWAEAGFHEMEFSLQNYIGGAILYYELVTPVGSLTRKMIVTRE